MFHDIEVLCVWKFSSYLFFLNKLLLNGNLKMLMMLNEIKTPKFHSVLQIIYSYIYLYSVWLVIWSSERSVFYKSSLSQYVSQIKRQNLWPCPNQNKTRSQSFLLLEIIMCIHTLKLYEFLLKRDNFNFIIYSEIMTIE